MLCLASKHTAQYERQGSQEEWFKLQFLPDTKLASKFKFCCKNRTWCHDLQPDGKINRFAKVVGVDSMLSVVVSKKNFGACQLQMDGWRTTVYGITIVALKELQFVAEGAGSCLHRVAYGCAEYEMDQLVH